MAELRGVRTNRWKYVRAQPELYDLLNDPGESRNVIGAHPRKFGSWRPGCEPLRATREEKLETAPMDRNTMKQLKSLGYLVVRPNRR